MDQDTREGSPELTETKQTETRDPEEIRREIEETRRELGDTVEALAEKTDVKAQAREKVEEVKERVAGAGPAAEAAKRNPLPVAAGGAFVLGFLFGRLTSRS